jgi:hypothetical protein
MKNKKAQELQDEYCDALVKMILFPEPRIGQTFDSMRPIDEHVETLAGLLKKGVDPTILKRLKTIVNSLSLD